MVDVGIVYVQLVFFIAIWYILWLFGTFYGYLVYIFWLFGTFSPILVCYSKKNLATLDLTCTTQRIFFNSQSS
jgi:hypothetical protein